MQAEVDILTRLIDSLVAIAALSLLSAAVAGSLAVVHRWYARTTVPVGLSVLFGVTAVALVLNVDSTLASLLATNGNMSNMFAPSEMVVNTVTLACSAVTAAAGGRAGDRLGEATGLFASGRETNLDISAVVRATGRVITVTLPDDIDDMDGHDPVEESVKTRLSGTTLIFPRRLTVEELRQRLVDRLRDEYGVGAVDVDIDIEGTVEYLAVGSRQAGLGPTLPPETCAVAIRADPAFSASAGDLVRVYRPDEAGPEQVAVGEVRGISGETVTLAADGDDARRLDPETQYRLTTRPVEPRADREFASLLRAADETMGVVTLTEGSSLVGTAVSTLDVSVAAVHGPDGVEPLVAGDRVLAAGETLYVIAKPDSLRRLEAAATATGADSD